MTNGHNPLGYILEITTRRIWSALLTKHDVPFIEDDIYGDITLNGPRPKPAKVYDTKGLVLLCSSFSKVLAPGLRVGWISAGRFQDTVARLKFINTISTPSLPQLAIAEFIDSGGYDRHLRTLRLLAAQVQTYSQAVVKYFPEGTKVSRPAGGYVLWVELPESIDGVKLYRQALAQNVAAIR